MNGNTYWTTGDKITRLAVNDEPADGATVYLDDGTPVVYHRMAPALAPAAIYFYQSGKPVENPVAGAWVYDANGNQVQVPGGTVKTVAAKPDDGRDPFERRVPVYDNGRPVMEPGPDGTPEQLFRVVGVTERLAEIERRLGI